VAQHEEAVLVVLDCHGVWNGARSDHFELGVIYVYPLFRCGICDSNSRADKSCHR